MSDEIIIILIHIIGLVLSFNIAFKNIKPF